MHEGKKQQETNINSKLMELAMLQDALRKKGGLSEDGKLFEEIIDFENEILKSFGLPLDPHYLGMIQFDNLPDERDINDRIEQLKKAAIEYLMSNAKSDLQILRDASELMPDAFHVLPELKIITHVYTIFV